MAEKRQGKHDRLVSQQRHYEIEKLSKQKKEYVNLAFSRYCLILSYH